MGQSTWRKMIYLVPEQVWECNFHTVCNWDIWIYISVMKLQQSSKLRAPAKLTTLVDFPLYGFDMSPHLANRPTPPGSSVVTPGMLGSPPGSGGVLGGLGWSPWKRPRRAPLRHDDNVYDLYAICNHHGQDLQGGHYTGMEFNGNCRLKKCTEEYMCSEKLLQTNFLVSHVGKEFPQRFKASGM